MNIILDTCSLLYAAFEKQKLSQVASDLISNPLHQLFLSSISSYEIIVKYKLGKLKLTQNPVEFILECRDKFNILELPVMEKEIAYMLELPNLHGDPFDRIIIAQALANDFFILTPDKLIHNYKMVKVVW